MTGVATDFGARRKVMAGAQLQRNQRPLTAQLLIRLSETYAIDPRDFAGAEDSQGASELEEVLADPLLAPLGVPKAELRAALDHAPTLVAALKRLHTAYQDAAEIGTGVAGARSEAERGEAPPAVDAVERLRGFLQERENHFPVLENLSEGIAAELVQVTATCSMR